MRSRAKVVAWAWQQAQTRERWQVKTVGFALVWQETAWYAMIATGKAGEYFKRIKQEEVPDA